MLLLAVTAALAADPVSLAPDVTITPLGDDVWMHTSIRTLPEWGPVPSNGLLVDTPDGSFLIDTAWNDQQTRLILDWAFAAGLRLTGAIVTHAHDDKMGGLGAVHERGIPSYASALTNELAPVHGLVPARRAIAEPWTAFGGGALEVFDPGPAHTRDNIVVYIPGADLLFGGCLIRPGESSTLGNVAEADVAGWDDAVRRIARRYRSPAIVVPSHGAPAGAELYRHTIRRVRAHRAGR